MFMSSSVVSKAVFLIVCIVIFTIMSEKKRKMLVFNLKKEWYEKIKSGEKKIEYREVKPYWSRKLTNSNFFGSFREECIRTDGCYEFAIYTAPCVFRLGHSSKGELQAIITFIEVINGKDTDLHIDKDVYAIHFDILIW